MAGKSNPSKQASNTAKPRVPEFTGATNAYGVFFAIMGAGVLGLGASAFTLFWFEPLSLKFIGVAVGLVLFILAGLLIRHFIIQNDQKLAERLSLLNTGQVSRHLKEAEDAIAELSLSRASAAEIATLGYRLHFYTRYLNQPSPNYLPYSGSQKDELGSVFHRFEEARQSREIRENLTEEYWKAVEPIENKSADPEDLAEAVGKYLQANLQADTMVIYTRKEFSGSTRLQQAFTGGAHKDKIPERSLPIQESLIYKAAEKGEELQLLKKLPRHFELESCIPSKFSDRAAIILPFKFGEDLHGGIEISFAKEPGFNIVQFLTEMAPVMNRHFSLLLEYEEAKGRAKELNKKLREKPSRLDVLQQTELPLFFTDAEGTLQYANRWIKQLPGEKITQHKGKQLPLDDLLTKIKDNYRVSVTGKYPSLGLDYCHIVGFWLTHQDPNSLVWLVEDLSESYNSLQEAKAEIQTKVEEEEQLQNRLAAIRLANKELEDLRQAIDSAAVVSETDAKGKILEVNEAFLELSKYERNEVIGKNHRLLKSGHQEDRVYEQLWENIAKGETWSGELKNRAKDGTFYWLHITIVPFQDSSGNILRHIAIGFDITAQKLQEEQIKAALGLSKEQEEEIRKQSDELQQAYEDMRSSQREYSALIDALHLGAAVLETDPKGTLRKASDKGLEILATDKQHLLGEPIFPLMEASAFHTPPASFEDFLEEEGYWQGFLYLIRADGERTLTKVTISPVLDFNYQPQRFVFTFVPLEQAQQKLELAEQQLQTVQQTSGELAEVQAHLKKKVEQKEGELQQLQQENAVLKQTIGEREAQLNNLQAQAAQLQEADSAPAAFHEGSIFRALPPDEGAAWLEQSLGFLRTDQEGAILEQSEAISHISGELSSTDQIDLPQVQEKFWEWKKAAPSASPPKFKVGHKHSFRLLGLYPVQDEWLIAVLPEPTETTSTAPTALSQEEVQEMKQAYMAEARRLRQEIAQLKKQTGAPATGIDAQLKELRTENAELKQALEQLQQTIEAEIANLTTYYQDLLQERDQQIASLSQ